MLYDDLFDENEVVDTNKQTQPQQQSQRYKQIPLQKGVGVRLLEGACSLETIL